MTVVMKKRSRTVVTKKPGDANTLRSGSLALKARHGAVLGGIALAATLLAACGGSTSNASAGASPSSTSSGASGFAAYENCLKQHGVTLPSFSARPRPTGSHTGGYGGYGGGGFGGGFGGASANPQMQAAAQACASDRPSGFGGGGFGAGSTALTAFRNCMAQQGEPVPTTRPTSFPTARPTATATGPEVARYLDGLNPSDPKVAAALHVCEALLPTRSPGAGASSSAG